MARKGRNAFGLAEAVLGEIDLLRPQRDRVKAVGNFSSGRGFQFSSRASQLWRFALGSNAAVLKKIGKGGTTTAKELAAQMAYLFSKSAAIFGNGVVLDDQARGLSREAQDEIIGAWVEDWRGAPRNGQTTHLLLSFPSHVKPEKARLIAEVWAFEMFQSGTHQDEVWSYVAALHTDRPHPHVHIVVNNRGTLNDSWLYMAREHVFNLDAMKGRMVAIAAEEGVFLEATSRAERGLMSYGLSRGEIESARKEGRMPVVRLREGRALDEALATRDRAAETMHSLSHVAALTGLLEIGERIARAEDVLRRGGVVHPFPADVVHGDRADLDRQFKAWMAETGDKIRTAPGADRKELLDELHGYAGDIARGLGDVRSAQLLQMMPQSVIYGVALQGEVLTRGRVEATLQPGKADRLRAEIMADAVGIGLSAERIASRLDTGALNAWEERDWVRSDLSVLAAWHRYDLADPDQRRRVAEDLQGFYDRAARAIDLSVETSVVPENDRLIRTLRSMGRRQQAEGSVAFRGEADAERFTAELQERYGEEIVSELAAGRTDALASDVEDEGERRWIARALVSAAKSHVALGLTLRQVAGAERLLADVKRLTDGKDWEF